MPGIGKKTALRLVLHLLREDVQKSENFAEAIVAMRRGIKTCRICFNLSDEAVCAICSDPRRDRSTVCVVENIRDVMAIEDTAYFRGLYHVLGGVISPIEGVGPADLSIEPLLERVATGEVQEVVMAISPTMEGETTMHYVSQALMKYPVKVSILARGISFGGELEYADVVTLGRSIAARVPFHQENGEPE